MSGRGVRSLDSHFSHHFFFLFFLFRMHPSFGLWADLSPSYSFLSFDASLLLLLVIPHPPPHPHRPFFYSLHTLDPLNFTSYYSHYLYLRSTDSQANRQKTHPPLSTGGTPSVLYLSTNNNHTYIYWDALPSSPQKHNHGPFTLIHIPHLQATALALAMDPSSSQDEIWPVVALPHLAMLHPSLCHSPHWCRYRSAHWSRNRGTV